MPVVIRSHGAVDTERSRLPESKLRRVTVLRRVVHKIARSGVAPRHVGVQRPDDDGSHAAQRVSYSRFEAVIGVNEGTRPSRAVYAGLVLAVLVLLSACSSPSATQSPAVSTSTSASSPSTPSPSPDPTASASSEALATYSAFWDAKVASQAKPAQGPPAALARYSIDKALADAQAAILIFRHSGIEMRGKPAHSAEVTSVTLTATPMVSIRDCLDSTRWLPVYSASGKSALAPGQSARVVVDSTATTYDGRWVISASVAHRDQPC